MLCSLAAAAFNGKNSAKSRGRAGRQAGRQAEMAIFRFLWVAI